MKKIILFGLLTLVLFISAVNGAIALVGQTSSAVPMTNMHVMKVSMINQIPDPAEPGKYEAIKILNITNDEIKPSDHPIK